LILKSPGFASCEHETQHDQNRAKRENARQESGHNPASACGTRRARRHAATTPKQHSAEASEADNGNGKQREPVRRSEPCHCGKPRASKAEGTE
jgi:hypothetical protein